MLLWFLSYLKKSNLFALTILRPIYLMLRLVSRKEVISVQFYSTNLLMTYPQYKSTPIVFYLPMTFSRKIFDPSDCQLLQHDFTSISKWYFNNLLAWPWYIRRFSKMVISSLPWRKKFPFEVKTNSWNFEADRRLVDGRTSRFKLTYRVQ